MGNANDIAAKLRRWIVDEGSRKDASALTDDSDIVQEGFLDSLGLMGLIAYVEELLERPLAESELRMENFTSVDRIVKSLFTAHAAATAFRK